MKSVTIQAKNKNHLKVLVRDVVGRGHECVDLNHIDVSLVKNFSYLFGEVFGWKEIDNGHSNPGGSAWYPKKIKLNVDISKWDVSSGVNFVALFDRADFCGDLSGWDMRAAKQVDLMFHNSSFNGDIARWNMRGVVSTNDMFHNSAFRGDVSGWNLDSLQSNLEMFKCAPESYLESLDPGFWWGWNDEDLVDGFCKSEEWATNFTNRKLKLLAEKETKKCECMSQVALEKAKRQL